MAKINLLFVITKLELGGAQKQLLNLIRGLDRGAYNLFLLTANRGKLLEEAAALPGVVLKRSRFLERRINPLKDLAALLEIRAFIKKNKIDIVHTHSSKAGIVGRLAGRLANTGVIIHTVHGWSFHPRQHRLAHYFYLFLEKICAAFTTSIIVVSQWDKNTGLAKGVGKSGQYVLIRYGIDYGLFPAAAFRQQAREKLGLDSRVQLVGTVACFKPQKAPLDFIKFARALKVDLPAVKFIMVGAGVLLEKSRRLAKQSGLEGEIIFTGWRSDIPQILAALDVFVLGSLWEGLPIAVMEAMASGLAVAATNTGGIAEIMDKGGECNLVEPGDFLGLKDKVKDLLINRDKRDRLAQSCRENIIKENFSVEQNVKNTHQLYLELYFRRINA